VSWRVECRPTIIKPPKDPFAATRYPQSGAYKRLTSSQEPPIRVTHSVALHYLSEAILLWIVDDFLRTPAKEAFRAQALDSWPAAVQWLL
jgi:hypothetical protein